MQWPSSIVIQEEKTMRQISCLHKTMKLQKEKTWHHEKAETVTCD